MGQTLENGVYLPSEGERNCYAGLKTNWEILDQKVADVTALQQAVAGALHREIVESLPTTDIDPNTIYMVLSGTSATENVYNEFMYVNNAWELIGTSATDLTNYYTKSEVDGKLLLKANASDLTSHTGDTTIHVTTADKNKWNNQTYVFRYSSTALVASSTNSNALLDNTDNLKIGDKVIDSDGVLFSITAIDTANSTFTIGTALIDLAQDSDVVHKSGDETVGGTKVFSDINAISNSAEIGVSGGNNSFKILDKNKKTILRLDGGTYSSGMAYSYFLVNNGSDVFNGVTLYQSSANSAQLRPYSSTLSVQLGSSSRYFSDCYTSKINGVEPSSLSLPSDRNARIDISSYITNLGDGNFNTYTVPANGYIWLSFIGISRLLCYSKTSDELTNYAQTFARNGGDGLLNAFFPVRKNDNFIVQISTSSTAVVQNAYFIPCQGNV